MACFFATEPTSSPWSFGSEPSAPRVPHGGPAHADACGRACERTFLQGPLALEVVVLRHLPPATTAGADEQPPSACNSRDTQAPRAGRCAWAISAWWGDMSGAAHLPMPFSKFSNRKALATPTGGWYESSSNSSNLVSSWIASMASSRPANGLSAAARKLQPTATKHTARFPGIFLSRIEPRVADFEAKATSASLVSHERGDTH